MKELEYPFDSEYIIANIKKLRRQLITSCNLLPVKIAVLGGSTTDHIVKVLELFLLDAGIRPEFYESEYDQYFQESVFPNNKLKEFNPDIIYLYTSNHNIEKYPDLDSSEETVNQMLKTELNRFFEIWSTLDQTYHCTIIQNNFELPYYRLLGNRDFYDIHGAVHYITQLNLEFARYARIHERFYICDINYISADYGLKNWSDPMYWHMYKYALAIPAIPYLCANVANIIKSLYGKNKKGLVCDLDNTLWGGVIGDDGISNIAIGHDEPEGQAYLSFQNYIRAQKQIGIVLSIDSKNDPENALAGLRHPDSLLKEDDFACIKANWNPKDQNFREIADELSLLPESLVFLDDNPAERHIVTSQIPGVKAPALTDIAHNIEMIDRSGFFEVTNFSTDDKRRSDMYQENIKRNQQRALFSDYGEYLKSLEMRAVIKPFEDIYIPRIAQLTNKSNQFNLTTKRYTPAEIESAAASPEYITLYGKLMDKFGDNGLVSVLIGHIINGECHIDLWLMSCRVLKRDMELAMMDALAASCQIKGIHKIIGYYYPTAKNRMVEHFYEALGFVQSDWPKQDGTKWCLDLADSYSKKNKYIFMEETQ